MPWELIMLKRAKVESDMKILTERTAKNKLMYKGKLKELMKNSL